MYTDLNQHK
ncbi:hypothetical protein LSH36_300g04103 [Paralvinella palmiformis]|uniref:Uncharacterized protein n=1 Tax=Paralvinella palmiformis TaxID=53620 RepID=A0AAD9JHM5_9ANNE|nr:hypothetical protein LSH36_300g04103 [Paralvinella palmiformis]